MENTTSTPSNRPVPFQAKGLILILQKKKLLPSGGNSAYFMGRDEVLYPLHREGVWPVDDSFFYPFSGKECELLGELDPSGKIKVQSLKIIGEGYLMGKHEHLLPKQFEPIADVPTLTFPTGLALQLVKNRSSIYDSEPSRLYIRIRKENGPLLYSKVSLLQIELFLNDRISLLELIRLREDEPILQEKEIGNEIKSAVTYSNLKVELDSFSWNLVFFSNHLNPSDPQVAKEHILQKLQLITKNGIIGIYKDV